MKKLMAANWKMHKSRGEAGDTAAQLVEKTASALPADREVLLFAPFTCLAETGAPMSGKNGFALGAQNFYPAESGAFTGEISPAMLRELGCSYLLSGHSERRHVLGEGNEFINAKNLYALEQGFSLVFCIGETIDERKADRVEEVLRTQLNMGLDNVPADVAPERLSVAYEPVWAIGTGEVAGPQEILHAHAFVRQVLFERFGPMSKDMRLLYGGSVKPDNAAEIIGLDNVDGVLVGGASLAADSFAQIVLAGL